MKLLLEQNFERKASAGWNWEHEIEPIFKRLFVEEKGKYVINAKQLITYDTFEECREDLDKVLQWLFKYKVVQGIEGFMPEDLKILWNERTEERLNYMEMTLDSELKMPENNPVLMKFVRSSRFSSVFTDWGTRLNPWFFKDAMKALEEQGFIVHISKAEKDKILLKIADFQTVKVTIVDTKTDIKDAKGTVTQMDSKRVRFVVHSKVPKEIRDVTKFGKLKFYEFDTESWEKTETVLTLITEKYEGELYHYDAPFCAATPVMKWYEEKGLRLDYKRESPKPLPFALPGNIDSYLTGKWSFQEIALENWAKANSFGTVIIPTGGGKSFVAMKAIKVVNARTLILVITKELMFQWRDWLVEHLRVPANQIGLFYSGKKHEIKPITIAIYDSAAKYIDELREGFDFIIADECHHVPARTFRVVMLESSATIRMSLSATAWRYDGNSPLIFFAGGQPCYEISYDELITMKVVAPIIHQKVFTNLTEAELQAYTEASNKQAFNPGMRMKRIGELRRIAYMSEGKTPIVVQLVEKHKGDKILIFTYYLEQVESIHNSLENIGIKHSVITGQTPSAERADLFNRFKIGAVQNGDVPKRMRGDLMSYASENRVDIVITTSVLDEGIDVPDASVAIIASGYGSPRQFVQRTGRVVRWQKDKISYLYEIISQGTGEVDASNRRNETNAFKKQESTVIHSYEMVSDDTLLEQLLKAEQRDSVKIPEWRLIYAKFCEEGKLRYDGVTGLHDDYLRWVGYDSEYRVDYTKFHSLLGRLVKMGLVTKERKEYARNFDYTPKIAYWKKVEPFENKEIAQRVIDLVKRLYPQKLKTDRYDSTSIQHNIIVMRAIAHELGFSPEIVDKALCTRYEFSERTLKIKKLV